MEGGQIIRIFKSGENFAVKKLNISEKLPKIREYLQMDDSLEFSVDHSPIKIEDESDFTLEEILKKEEGATSMLFLIDKYESKSLKSQFDQEQSTLKPTSTAYPTSQPFQFTFGTSTSYLPSTASAVPFTFDFGTSSANVPSSLNWDDPKYSFSFESKPSSSNAANPTTSSKGFSFN